MAPQVQAAEAAPAPVQVVIVTPKRAGRMAFRAFLTSFAAYVLAIMACAMSATGKEIQMLKTTQMVMTLCFGIGAAYALVTLSKWKKIPNQPVETKLAGGIWIALMVIFSVSGLVGLAATDSAMTRRAAVPNASVSPSSTPAATTYTTPTTSWKYHETRDEMRDRTILTTCVESTNQLRFEFPYSGGSTASLCFRRRGNELNAYITIDKGQFICGLDSCGVNVKFDDGPIRTYMMAEPDSHDSKLLFFDSGEANLLATVKKTKHMKVEARFFQEGRRVMEFDTQGLNF